MQWDVSDISPGINLSMPAWVCSLFCGLPAAILSLAFLKSFLVEGIRSETRLK